MQFKLLNFESYLPDFNHNIRGGTEPPTRSPKKCAAAVGPRRARWRLQACPGPRDAAPAAAAAPVALATACQWGPGLASDSESRDGPTRLRWSRSPSHSGTVTVALVTVTGP